jgi:hypothetical protein
MSRQARDEMHVAGRPIELRYHDGRPSLPSVTSVVSHAEVYNMICVSYAARYVDEQRGISGNA